MSQRSKTITAGQQDVIIPGPVRGACPPPTEIVCIDARKVFDFCFQEETLERCFVLEEAVTEVVDCHIESVTCREVREREPIEGRDGFFLVSLQIDLILRITLLIEGMEVDRFRRITFVKRVVLCAPMGTMVDCVVTGTCICVLQEQTLPPGVVGIPLEVGDDDPDICCTIQLSGARIADAGDDRSWVR